MSKKKTQTGRHTADKPGEENPFLTDQADALWEALNQKGTPVSKNELQDRLKKLKENSK